MVSSATLIFWKRKNTREQRAMADLHAKAAVTLFLIQSVVSYSKLVWGMKVQGWKWISPRLWILCFLPSQHIHFARSLAHFLPPSALPSSSQLPSSFPSSLSLINVTIHLVTLMRHGDWFRKTPPERQNARACVCVSVRGRERETLWQTQLEVHCNPLLPSPSLSLFSPLPPPPSVTTTTATSCTWSQTVMSQ